MKDLNLCVMMDQRAQIRPLKSMSDLHSGASIKTWVSYNKLRKKKRAKKQTRLAGLRKNEVTTQTFARRRQTVSGSIIHFNEEMIKGQIKELVRGSVEETLGLCRIKRLSHNPTALSKESSRPFSAVWRST